MTDTVRPDGKHIVWQVGDYIRYEVWDNGELVGREVWRNGEQMFEELGDDVDAPVPPRTSRKRHR